MKPQIRKMAQFFAAAPEKNETTTTKRVVARDTMGSGIEV
jgi:hypothetical protein